MLFWQEVFDEEDDEEEVCSMLRSDVVHTSDEEPVDNCDYLDIQ